MQQRNKKKFFPLHILSLTLFKDGARAAGTEEAITRKAKARTVSRVRSGGSRGGLRGRKTTTTTPTSPAAQRTTTCSTAFSSFKLEILRIASQKEPYRTAALYETGLLLPTTNKVRSRAYFRMEKKCQMYGMSLSFFKITLLSFLPKCDFWTLCALILSNSILSCVSECRLQQRNCGTSASFEQHSEQWLHRSRCCFPVAMCSALRIYLTWMNPRTSATKMNRFVLNCVRNFRVLAVPMAISAGVKNCVNAPNAASNRC